MIDVSIPQEFRDARIEDTIGSELAIVIDYFNSLQYRGPSRTGIALFGDIGVGKTHAICALFNSIAGVIGAEGYELMSIFGVVTEVELVRNMRDFSKPMVSFETTFEEYVLRTCRYLLIDDVGKRQGESTSAQLQKYPDIFGHVLRERYSRKLLTYITSNQSGIGFLEAYGQSVWSLLNGCTDHRYEVTGNDRRLQHGK